MDTLTQIKVFVIGITSAILAFLEPIAGDLSSMLLLFGANALFGIVADIVDNKGWQKEKIKWAFIEALLFFFFVFLIYGIGFMKSNMDGALQCVSFVSYALIYYYGTNIARNMMNILPDESTGHRCFEFIYYILSVEFIRHIPFLSSYLKGKPAAETAEDVIETALTQ